MNYQEYIFIKPFRMSGISSSLLVLIINLVFIILGIISCLVFFIILGFILSLMSIYNLLHIKYFFYSFKLDSFGITLLNIYKKPIRQIKISEISKVEVKDFRFNTGVYSYRIIPYYLIYKEDQKFNSSIIFKFIITNSIICIPKYSNTDYFIKNFLKF